MLYIAYGSNMNLKQMKMRCPNSKVVGNGKLFGWKLVFNVHADIITTDDMKDEVPVVLWNIHDDDWDMLDRYEGYPHYYIRRNVLVMMDDGEIVEAIAYVMTDDRKGIALPYKEYFNTILRGYKDNGIKTDGLYDALTYSAYNETKYNQYNARR